MEFSSMNNNKIVIELPQEKLDLLKKLGLSPKDVFIKGLQESLRQRYRDFNLMDDDDEEEEIELVSFSSLSKDIREIENFMISENDIANN